MKPMINSLADDVKCKEVENLVFKIMKSGKYTEGENVAQFEEACADLTTSTYAVSFSNCGSALFTVYRWLREKGHHKVVVPNNTFYATAAMAAEAGLIPVLCDTGSMDPSMSVDSMIAAVVSSGATAVCLCHIAGWLATDYEEIAQWCDEHNVVLFEDAAHAFGVRNHNGYAPGTLSLGAVFSFYPTKAVPGGEGGVLVTCNTELLEFALQFRNWGKKIRPGSGLMEYKPGFNLRMSEFDAAVLRVQVWHTPEILANRLSAATQLQEAGYTCLMGSRTIYSNYHKYPVLIESVPESIRRVGKVYGTTDLLTNACNSNYTLWTPVSLHNSYEWAARHICLPVGENLYEGMSSAEIREYLECA